MAALTRRDVLAALAAALLASALFAMPQLDRLRGLGIDLLTGLRWWTLGPARAPASSPAVVVAIDEETYNTAPFSRTPTVTWTRELARIVNALVEGGAAVVGFDIVFPNSIEQSEMPFGEETLGARLRGFDRDFLRALAVAARAGKVVLGQIQHQQYPIQPADAQRVAVGHQRNIRPLNFHTDADDIVRRVPITIDIDGEAVPSMAVELAARAAGVPARPDGDGGLAFGSRRMAARVPNTIAVNFEGGGEDIPSYSLADLRACLERGDADFFRRQFAGKVVLIGTVLDIEDRKVTSKRFATGLEGAGGVRCALPAAGGKARFARDSIAGVYVHATAVNNLLRGETLIEPARGWQWAALAGIAFLAAAAALVLSPVAAALALAALLLAWTAAAVWAFAHTLVLPLVDAFAAGLTALFTTIGYRFAVVDRDKRFLRKSFALYLPPAVIDTMLASNKPPVLGGELRNVTVYFSDVAGFSRLAEQMPPGDLVALMNAYLSAMTDIIEAHGGFVDKYIGDAIVAIFGAPLDDAVHAQNAVRAALACRARLEEMNRSRAAVFMGHALGQRIGLGSGHALIGNIGSRRRFNYTAMGDAVNIAARLEGANKVYGTSIIASAECVLIAGAIVQWRELDLIRAAGMSRPLPIFEPLAGPGGPSREHADLAAAYAEGLRRWRARDFAGAAEAFAAHADHDPPSRRFLERAKSMLAQPPGAGWEPINVLGEK